jgi:hypothetical protein
MTLNLRIETTATLRHEVFREPLSEAQHRSRLRPRRHWEQGLGCS